MLAGFQHRSFAQSDFRRQTSRDRGMRGKPAVSHIKQWLKLEPCAKQPKKTQLCFSTSPPLIPAFTQGVIQYPILRVYAQYQSVLLSATIPNSRRLVQSLAKRIFHRRLLAPLLEPTTLRYPCHLLEPVSHFSFPSTL